MTVWGEYALFTRPEFSVERMSYPFMTPSAARGILDAILYKPQMRWHVRSITALRPRTFPAWIDPAVADQPYRMITIRRNEIQGMISSKNVNGWRKDPSSCVPYLVDSAGEEGIQGKHRTQRNTLMLHHVAYKIDAVPVLTVEASDTITVAKYVEMFERRVQKGQCFHRPYFGCREFAVMFAPSSEDDVPLTDWNESLGMMLYDIKFGPKGNRPGFFQAHIRQGVLNCDTRPTDGSEPIRVYGWEDA